MYLLNFRLIPHEFAVLTGIAVLLIFSNFLVTEFFSKFTSTHVLGCCNMLQ